MILIIKNIHFLLIVSTLTWKVHEKWKGYFKSVFNRRAIIKESPILVEQVIIIKKYNLFLLNIFF